MDLILFGMQGAGKGTLGKTLAKRYKMEIFETGGELRKLSQEDSELAKKVKTIVESGKLVPNEVVMEIVENFMKNLPANTPVLFDGIPRKVEQANTLNELLNKYQRNFLAIQLEIKKETALKRLTQRRICYACKNVYPGDYKEEKCPCGGKLIVRSDDNPEAIDTRLNAFENETVPAIKIYRDQLIKIDGEPNIEEVNNLAYKVLDPIMTV